jgi:hypothetical protein
MRGMEITTKIGCTNSCCYCPQERLIEAYMKKSNVLLMSFDVFKTCLDKIPSNVEIIFSGFSEPWLNPECTKMVLYAHEKGHKISVFTTLVGMKPSDIELLEPIPFEGFFVHLPTEQGLEKIRVDDEYLKILERLSKSKIKVRYHVQDLGDIHPAVKPLIHTRINNWQTCSRAGNIKLKDIPPPKKRRGVIGCRRNLEYNVLLPNGDVVLCCIDFGLQHILGNLLESDYDSLFKGKEFMRVKKGLSDESSEILCRYCTFWTYNASLSAKIHNKYLPKLKKEIQIVSSKFKDTHT